MEPHPASLPTGDHGVTASPGCLVRCLRLGPAAPPWRGGRGGGGLDHQTGLRGEGRGVPERTLRIQHLHPNANCQAHPSTCRSTVGARSHGDARSGFTQCCGVLHRGICHPHGSVLSCSLLRVYLCRSPMVYGPALQCSQHMEGIHWY